jgi:2-oxoisovalerate dehydrogenase E1 component
MAAITNHVLKSAQLSRELLLGAYRTMYLSRQVDEKEIQFKRQNRAYFQINGVGHEAIGVAVGLHLRPGVDWFYPYYRDRALVLQLGQSPLDMLLQAVGAKADPMSGGRQMPSHWSSKPLHIVSRSSPTGTQVLQAVGAADATLYFSVVQEAAQLASGFQADELVYASLGDGATSEGEFWESLNWACLRRLPVLYVVQDNGYAISVPVDHQTAGGSISKLVASFPHLLTLECDGTDFPASYDTARQAVDYVRAHRGPALIHAHVVRPYSHSLSDDERAYKPEEVRKQEAKRDPVRRLEKLLLGERHVTEKELKDIQASVNAEVREAADEALAAEAPSPATVLDYIYSPTVDPTGEHFDHPPRFQGDEKTMVDLINACLRDEMARDPRIVLFGEDVADASHEEVLSEAKGKGGVFGVTWGLQKLFGGQRVYNSPLAEANIVGRAIGMATLGLRPVVEIQFFDYIWPAMMQMRNELSNLRWRSNNAFAAPVIIRTAYGGYLQGGAPYHSQCGESIFAHCPGLRVVIPSTAMDANGLLRTALRGEDPVLFLEHKHLYRQPYAKSPYPGPDYTVPFGRARRVREGSDVTVVTYGALVQRSYLAAQEAAEQGVEAEILDLRTLQPLDFDSIASSVRKTGRVIVAHEDTLFCGFGAEVAARIADECFMDLDAPVRRVAALDCMVAYAPKLEDHILPQKDDVLRAILELARY